VHRDYYASGNLKGERYSRTHYAVSVGIIGTDIHVAYGNHLSAFEASTRYIAYLLAGIIQFWPMVSQGRSAQGIILPTIRIEENEVTPRNEEEGPQGVVEVCPDEDNRNSIVVNPFVAVLAVPSQELVAPVQSPVASKEEFSSSSAPPGDVDPQQIRPLKGHVRRGRNAYRGKNRGRGGAVRGNFRSGHPLDA
jgi:hypothetical protein